MWRIPIRFLLQSDVGSLLFVYGIYFGIPILCAAYVYRDASRRGDDHSLAWAAATLFSGGIAVLLLYVHLRDPEGTASG